MSDARSPAAQQRRAETMARIAEALAEAAAAGEDGAGLPGAAPGGIGRPADGTGGGAPDPATLRVFVSVAGSFDGVTARVEAARARLAAGDVGNPALADRMREVEIWCLEGWRFHQIAGADRGTGSELGQFDLAIGVVAGDWLALPDGLGSVAQRGRAGAGPTEVVILHQLARSAMRETEPLPQRAREVRDRLSTLIAAEPGLAGLKIAFGSFADGDDLERQVTSVLGSWIARQMRGETGAEPPPRPAGAHEVAPGPAANDGRGPGQTAKPRGGAVKPAPAASARRALKLAPATPGQPRQTRQARLLTQPLRLGIGGVKPPVVMPPRAAAPKPPPDGDGRGPAGTGRNAGNAPAPPLAPNPDRNPDADPDAGPDRQFPPHPGARRDPATEMPRSPGPAHAPQHGAVPGRGTPPFSDDGRATPTEAAPPRTAPLTAPPTPPLPNPGDRPTGAGQARDSTPSGRGEHERRKLSIASWPAALASAMADPPNAPQQRVEPGSAYPGQRAFRTEEAALFFGREGAVDDALTRLAEARQRGTAFLLVEGASGVGKTSFVEAGLIPRLATARPVPRIARMAAGAAPFLELASTLVDAGALPDDDETPDRLRAELATWLERGGDAVALLRTSNTLQGPADSPLSERGEAAPTRLVLVVDALERLEQAGVPARTRSALMHQFGQLARAPGMLVIASARRGATAHDAELLALALAGARFELPPLDAPGLEAAMRRPARAARLSFGRGPSGDGLDRALLADAEGPGALAHLADALGRLATQAGGRHDEPPWRLAEPDYAEMGGLAGLAARAAERAVVALDGEAQAALPRLLAQLADPVEDEAAHGAAETEREPEMPRYRHRRIARGVAMPNDASRRLVDALVAARFLVDDGDALVLALDGALEAWPAARDALVARSSVLALRPALEQAATDHAAAGRSPETLLTGRRRIEPAREALATDATLFSPAVHDFVDASVRAAGRRRLRLAGAVAAPAVLAAAVVAMAVFDQGTTADRGAASPVAAGQDAGVASTAGAGAATGAPVVADGGQVTPPVDPGAADVPDGAGAGPVDPTPALVEIERLENALADALDRLDTATEARDAAVSAAAEARARAAEAEARAGRSQSLAEQAVAEARQATSRLETELAATEATRREALAMLVSGIDTLDGLIARLATAPAGALPEGVMFRAVALRETLAGRLAGRLGATVPVGGPAPVDLLAAEGERLSAESRFAEARAVWSQALVLLDAAPGPDTAKQAATRATLEARLAEVALTLGDPAAAREAFAATAPIAPPAGDPATALTPAATLVGVGDAERASGDAVAAAATYDAAVTRARAGVLTAPTAPARQRALALSLGRQAALALARGEAAAARAPAEEALAISRALASGGSTTAARDLAVALIAAGRARQAGRAGAAARAAFEEAAGLARRLDAAVPPLPGVGGDLVAALAGLAATSQGEARTAALTEARRRADTLDERDLPAATLERWREVLAAAR